MIFTPKETLEEIIPQILLKAKTAQEIQCHQKIRARKVSVQAIYKALRKLIAAGVVVKHRQSFATSQEWLTKFHDLRRDSDMFVPEQGSKVQFDFHSFAQVDAYWKHIVFRLPEKDLHAPFYSYLPHNFWIYHPQRFESELRYYAEFEVQQRDGYLVIGGNLPADMAAKKQLQNAYLRINTIPYGQFRRTEHIAVMGDFITTTKLSVHLAREIDALYEQYPEEDIATQLEKIFKRKTHIKITLEHSSIKASRLRKTLGKDFFIPPKIKTMRNIL